MNENVENLILAHLREIRAAVESVDRKVDRLSGRVDELDEGVQELDLKINGLAGMIATLTCHFISHDERIVALETRD